MVNLRRFAQPFVVCAGLAGALTVAPSIAEAQVIVVAPPEPQVEVQPVAPYPGAVWAPGYWEYRGRRHVWVAGRYYRPRPGYVWRPHAWVHEGRGWRMHRGGWYRN